MKDLKSLAVIGSFGMVGSDLMRYLQPYFDKVVGIDRGNYEEYRGQKFDVVLNANGNSNKIWANKNALEDFEASTVSVYKSLLDFPCKTYVYISSSDVYENHSSEKVTSESNSINPENLSPYGLHKYISEFIVRNISKNYLIFRCSMMLGSKLRKGPIYDILQGPRLYISEKSAFQMITTDEITKIIHSLLSTNITREIFNIGGKGTVLLSEIEKAIKKTINFPKNAKTEIYETNISKLDKIYPLKTSDEYLKDFLKKYIMR